MKRTVKSYFPLFNGYMSADIIIDKNGMRIENKEPGHEDDDFIIREMLTKCINMDHWKYSRHMEVRNAMSKGSEERKKIRKIIKEKIKQREDEIQFLKDGLNILGRWNPLWSFKQKG
jgi:hypothetical protein